MMEREGFSEAAHRYLDGEPVGPMDAEERAAADRLSAGARAYAAHLEPVAPSFDELVMAAVEARATTRQPGGGGVHWLFAPRTVRVRPVWIPALAAAAALALWLVPRHPASVPPAPAVAVTPVAAATPDTVYVHFELVAPQAHSVSVAGSFNGWRVGALQMTRRSDGLWSVTAPLSVGEHRYDFVVDGTHWVPDPTAHNQVEDGFGGRNSVIVVGPRGLVRS